MLSMAFYTICGRLTQILKSSYSFCRIQQLLTVKAFLNHFQNIFTPLDRHSAQSAPK